MPGRRAERGELRPVRGGEGQPGLAFATEQAALAARERGLELVNIAQPFKSSGMMLTCLKESGVASPADFKGKTLGVWFFGNEFPFLSWMNHLGLKTDGGPEGVTVLKQGFNVDPLLQKQAACISTMTYNEYALLLETIGMPDSEFTALIDIIGPSKVAIP